VWTAENLINRTRLMAAKNGAALYRSHDLDAGKILFIQPIFKPAVLVSHQCQLSVLWQKQTRKKSEHRSAYRAYITILTGDVRLHGTSEDQWRGFKTIS
jgi:hypothetical protein